MLPVYATPLTMTYPAATRSVYRLSRKTTLRGKITIPSKVTIGKTSYTVTIIGKDAFADQKNLTSVILPPTITNIKSGAFF